MVSSDGQRLSFADVALCLISQMRANDISWSPIEPTVFALASEDHNMYTFDMRNMSSALQIYKDHVSAVMSVDFSPTGQELVTGSYDRTLRLWDAKEGAHSRDVYHGARMQRIFASLFTLDARFVVSGSDDGNVRIWKAKASEKLGIHGGKERAKREYGEKLINRWKTTGDVGRIAKQRKVPKAVKGAQKVKRDMIEAERVKEERRRKHTRAGESKPKAARQSAVLAQKE
jgi:WD repeat and SOF domain-containing protein 1